jgi:hypothetical protein
MRQDTRPSIHLYIDRLILDGLPIERTQASHIQMAIEAELTRLLVENGLSQSLHGGVAVPSVRANAIQVTTGNNPVQMGNQIAQSIYSGIGNKK